MTPRVTLPKRRKTRSELSITGKTLTIFFVLTTTFLLYSIIAGKGILTSAIATGVLGFLTTLLFLFCIPDLDTFFALDAPQPFVQLYALALGKGSSIFMTIIAVIGLIMVSERGAPGASFHFTHPCGRIFLNKIKNGDHHP